MRMLNNTDGWLLNCTQPHCMFWYYAHFQVQRSYDYKKRRNIRLWIIHNDAKCKYDCLDQLFTIFQNPLNVLYADRIKEENDILL